MDGNRLSGPVGGLDPTDPVYRALFEAYPDALLLVNARGLIELANPAATRLLGYGEAEFIGLSVDDLVPDGVRPRHAGYRDGFHRTPHARPMGTTRSELVARHRSGAEVVVEIALSPLPSKGAEAARVVAAVRGVADYPRVQQALRRWRYAEQVAQLGRLAVGVRDAQAFLQQVPDVAMKTLRADAASLLMLDADRRHVRLMGGTGPTGKEPIGWRFELPEGSPGQQVATSQQSLVLNDVQTSHAGSLPADHLAAGFRSALLVPVSDHRQTVGVLAVRAREVGRFGEDERVTLESMASLLATTWQRAQSEQALEHAQRLESVGQLTGGIAHDFNNLLTVIQGNLQVLEELPVLAGSPARVMVDAAMRASRRAADLTAKLLAFSRRQALQSQRVDVNELLRSLTDMLSRTLDPRVQISWRPAHGLPAVKADAAQLESALLNIAINARDAMPDGGELTIRTSVAQWPSSMPAHAADSGPSSSPRTEACVVIHLTDSGHGMSPEVLQRVFEPFFTTKPAGRGTGLGLATVYGFARQSQGTIEVESVPGQGSTFSLYLPLWQGEVAASSSQAERRVTDADQPLPEGLRVLLVEDEPAVRDVVQRYLEDLHCQVTACSDVPTALGRMDEASRSSSTLAAPARPFDVLLSDVVLGSGLRGTALAEQAVLRFPGMAVLLMSGFSQDLLDGPADRSARWPLLRKPCSREQLAAALVHALGQAHEA